MKLQQGQLWKSEGTILRITRLERMAVEYKALVDPPVEEGEGTHHRVTKKEFCRLIKGSVLTAPTA